MTNAHLLSKSALRQASLEQRRQVSPAAREEAARLVCDLFFRHAPVTAGAVVAGYWPVRDELDDLPLLRELTRRGHVCALPQTAGEGAPLVFRVWRPDAPVMAGAYGIPEPAGGEILSPDIVLVPVAAFDETGHRLGYGKGFYDRTLAYLRGMKPVLAVGLAFEVQRCEAIPAEAHDVRMDMILTERKAYR